MSRKYNIKVGVIGGSGLNNPNIMPDGTERIVDTPYGPTSDVLIEGKIGGVDCVLLARHGRKHSISPSNVNYRANIWALKNVGCTHVIVSSAVGSLQEDIRPGDFVLLDQFIDRTKARTSTFFDGSDISPGGVCHLPMEPVFCNKTRELLLESSEELGYKIHSSGTAIVIEGPRFSTKAESNLYRMWGGHVVNMTLFPECVLAKEAGLCYAVVAMATDYDCWHETVVSVEEVMKTFKANVEKITKLFVHTIDKIGQEKWDEIIDNLKKVCETSNMVAQEPSK